MLVNASAYVDGLIHIGPKPSVFTRKLVRAANGVDEVRRDVPFKILVSNFGSEKQFLAKGSIIAYEVRHHSMLVELEGEGEG